ncbi:MAG: helix-turn-helix domain-containing protein [Clostridium sp.]|jgi:purine catabolism regulator|nr:PucR family transcriptional regulator [Clostridium sp. TM06-18]
MARFIALNSIMIKSISVQELLLTLSQYIRCNYNKNETARELNLHRQSLIYRLKKIEELTGLSLNDHDSLYLPESCLRLLRLI